MDLRTGASVRRFESVEMGAVTIIVLASVVQGFFLSRLVPVLASLYAGAGEPLSLRLRVYIGLYNWFLILAPVVLVVWMGFQIAGRPLPAAIRRRVLMVVAALAGPVTIVGLYFIAEDSLMQAMRMSNIVAASAQVLERDLSYLSLASGDPDQVIASLEPKVSRDDFVTNVRYGSTWPGLSARRSVPSERRHARRAAFLPPRPAGRGRVRRSADAATGGQAGAMAGSVWQGLRLLVAERVGDEKTLRPGSRGLSTAARSALEVGQRQAVDGCGRAPTLTIGHNLPACRFPRNSGDP